MAQNQFLSQSNKLHISVPFNTCSRWNKKLECQQNLIVIIIYWKQKLIGFQ